MSELYLVLRNRLTAVTDWVQIGSDVMRAARNALGLSRESLARKIPVSSKTYERWENRGAVPVQSVTKIAEVLELEIERVELPAVKISLEEERASDAALLDAVQGLHRRLDRIEERLPERPAARKRRRATGGP